MNYKLNELLTPYKEINRDSLFEPVAIGKYGIRKRSEIYKKELSNDYSKNKVIRKNTLSIGLGSNQIDVGVLTTDEIYSVSPAYNTFKIDTQKVCAMYLELSMKYNNSYFFKKHSIATARQGKKVDMVGLLGESINIPNIDNQLDVIKKVTSIEDKIQKEKEQLNYFNELIKSRFNEQFINDPSFTTKKWYEVLNIINGRDYKGHEGTKYPIYGSGGFMGIYANNFLASGILTIIGRKGTIDRPLLVNGEIWNIDTAFAIKTNDEILNPLFFHYRSKFYDYQNLNKQTTKPSLRKSDLLKLDIEIPPMAIQLDFIKLVEIIDKLKFNCQQRIKLYQELLDKKMDEYFG